MSADRRRWRWDVAAFAAALLVYSVTRFWQLADYPIYFFCDEAFQPVTAEDVLSRGGRDEHGRFFPMYFNNGAWVPLFPVWLHAVTASAFGKSVPVARGTAAAVSVLAAAAIGLVLKLGLDGAIWWASPLFLAAIPAHFLHSRTTFETNLSTSFFAVFLLFYVLYRRRSPLFLYPALIFAALAFYSYSVGQLVVAVTALLLALVDLPCHVRQWRHALGGLLLIVVLAIPLLRFRLAEPGAAAGQLRRVSSPWAAKIPVSEKLRRAGTSYGRALSPRYWFFPNDVDYKRHRVGPFPQVPTYFLPLVALGLAISLWRFRSPPHRAILVSLAAAPAGALLADHAVTRALFVVVPLTILAALGVDTLLALIRPAHLRLGATVAVALGLSVASLQLLRNALVEGPLWYRDYKWGQQWGAKQIFEIVPKYLNSDPKLEVSLTSDWANGADLFPRFFLRRGSSAARRVRMGGVKDFSPEQLASVPPAELADRLERLPRTVYVMNPQELEAARSSPVFSSARVDRELRYPDGSPGFLFVRLSPSSRIDEIVAEGRARLLQEVDDRVEINGQTVAVRRSRMDIGRVVDIFDSNPATLGRFNGPNPALLELHFPRPTPIGKIRLALGSGSWNVVAQLRGGADGEPQTFYADVADARDPVLEVGDGRTRPTAVLTLRLRLTKTGEFAIIHLREVELR